MAKSSGKARVRRTAAADLKAVGGAGPLASSAQDTQGATPKSLRIKDMAQPKSRTEAFVASIADQLCAIVDDNYDIRIRLEDDAGQDTLQAQKLTVLINALLENVRRNIGSLSELAEELESKVQERTQKLDLIVQSSNDGVWLWDLSENTVEYSPRWRQILGLDHTQMSSIEDWLGRVHPEDQDKLRSALRAHLQGSDLFLREDYRIRHADGTYRWVWCRGRCQRDQNGRPVLMAGTQTDVHQLRSVDASTGLPNEDTFMSTLEGLIERRCDFRAMVIGVPRVVTMKEELSAKDLSVLRKSVARRLSATLPFTADLAHLSGDFYAGFMPGNVSDEELHATVFAPLRRAFERPFHAGGRAVWLNVTVGATMPMRQTGYSASDVIRDAWTSYQCARSAGRAFNLLEDRQIEAARDRARMQQEVRRALTQNWFVPFFQPIVDMRSRSILGFETLCRMQHPELGLVAPGRFIPVAEDLGIMDAIGDRMLAAAIDQLASWAQEGPPFEDLFLTVNLEAQQIMHPEFPPQLLRALQERGVPPRNLKLEIVESSVVGNFEQAARQISRVREFGVKIALDDFGTGYSSLEYLNQLSFDLLKIDKSFVDEIENEPRKVSLVRMICVLAETLEAQVCVEGIENEAQADLMAEMNAKFGQGYLFSKPVAQEALSEVLAAQ